MARMPCPAARERATPFDLAAQPRAGLLLGRPSPGARSASAGEAGAVVWVDETGSGSTITLRIGDALRVRLRAAPSAGYEWELADEPGSVMRFEGPPQIESTEPARRGARVDQVFRFVAQRAGTTPLRLMYRRSFERERPPVRTFRIEVRVLPRDAEEE